MTRTQPAETCQHHEQLSDFIAACAASTPHDEHALVHEGIVLLPAFDVGRGEGPATMQLETLLAVGGALSTVLGLIGEGPVFMVSRGRAGSCLATVMLEDVDVMAEGATPALALLGAWACALLAGYAPELEADGASQWMH